MTAIWNRKRLDQRLKVADGGSSVPSLTAMRCFATSCGGARSLRFALGVCGPSQVRRWVRMLGPCPAIRGNDTGAFERALAMKFPKQSELCRCGDCRSLPGVAKEMERVMGIEPTLAAWEAAVLPLNYTRTGSAILRNPGGSWQFYCVAGHALMAGERVGPTRGPRASSCGRSPRCGRCCINAGESSMQAELRRPKERHPP